MASTLCPTCTTRVEHPSNYIVVVVQNPIADGTQTKLIANDTLVIHTCTAHGESDVDAPAPE
jgi:hypothetical protein